MSTFKNIIWNLLKRLFAFPFLLILESYRLVRRIWFFAYYTCWKGIYEQTYNKLMQVIQSGAMILALSPHRALSYLFIFWVLGMVMVTKLKVDGDLVLSDPNSAPYVQAEAEHDSGIFSDISNMLEDLLKRDDKTDKSNNIFTSPITETKTESFTETVIDEHECKVKTISKTTETTKTIANHSCEKLINVPTYALDLLLPVFNLKESSKCALVGNASIFIKFCYLSYQILGAILAGLTLFSWAGILQNRLSK